MRNGFQKVASIKCHDGQQNNLRFRCCGESCEYLKFKSHGKKKMQIVNAFVVVEEKYAKAKRIF